MFEPALSRRVQTRAKYLSGKLYAINRGLSMVKKIEVLLQSFGFKYGRPSDADFIFDVRCLPNPYWQPELKLLSGLDAPVIRYLESQAIVQTLIRDLGTFIES